MTLGMSRCLTSSMVPRLTRNSGWNFPFTTSTFFSKQSGAACACNTVAACLSKYQHMKKALKTHQPSAYPSGYAPALLRRAPLTRRRAAERQSSAHLAEGDVPVVTIKRKSRTAGMLDQRPAG